MQQAATARTSVARQVASQLRAAILAGDLPIGGRIAGEHALMSRFSVSRQTVREALSELGTEGLVVSRCGPGGGVFVAAPDLDRLSGLLASAGAMIGAGGRFEPREVCRAIFEIEASCCRLAAQRCDPAAVARMRAAIAAAADPPAEPRAFFDRHTAFNRALWAGAGNAPLAFIMDAFMRSLRAALPRKTEEGELRPFHEFLLRNHRAVADAIAQGDGDGAVAHMEDNLAFWLVHSAGAAA